jgi:hypothetical protein
MGKCVYLISLKNNLSNADKNVLIKKPNFKIKSKAADLGYQNIFIKNFFQKLY